MISFAKVAIMKYLILLAGLAALNTGSAFPAIAFEAAKVASRSASEGDRAAHERRLNGILPGFNAAEQLVDVSGEHAFVPPDFSAGDLRGPCPGLNALANHNYLPHNGFATISQFVQATNQVFGMVS
jgi:hypothetical protein